MGRTIATGLVSLLVLVLQAIPRSVSVDWWVLRDCSS